MTTIGRQTGVRTRTRVGAPGDGGGARTRALTIRWPIAAAGLNGRIGAAAGGGEEVVLEWTFAPGRGAGAALFGPTGPGRPLRAVEHGRVVWLHDGPGGLEHVDIAGLLSATFRVDESGAVDVLYARTELLAELGVPGGRCDEPRGAVARR